MFKRQKIHPNTTDTFIGEGTLFEGRLNSKASIRVDGQVHGEIEAEGDVIIGKSGHVHANIKGRNIIISGAVTGNVAAQEAVNIHNTGSLQGDLECTTIAIEEGGVFSGNSNMQVHVNKQAASHDREHIQANHKSEPTKKAATG